MHLIPSKIPLEHLLNAAYHRKLHVGGDVMVQLDQVFYAAPGEEVEIWDRLQENEVNPIPFLIAEYAGIVPQLSRDGRRYRKLFENPAGLGRQLLTFCSSYYRLEVESAILQAKRVGQEDKLESASFVIVVCDKDNRMRLPAFLEENLRVLEYEKCEEVPTPFDDLLVGPRREVERSLLKSR